MNLFLAAVIIGSAAFALAAFCAATKRYGFMAINLGLASVNEALAYFNS